jgi:catechol 2,3-dioxygenase-like lactoylglutathione lyase family enzyme
MNPTRSLALVALVVRDYDEAIAFFTDVLRFSLVEDTPLSPDKRWVVVAPSRSRLPFSAHERFLG